MDKYRKKPIVIEAEQWFERGDVGDLSNLSYLSYLLKEDRDPCEHCNKQMSEHAWIKTLEGVHIVCPGDWIIKGIKGEYYPCKPDIFEATYDKENNDGK